MMKNGITPIFVLGSPRSGTTVIGSYISSYPEILDMGEYAGFDFSYRIANNEMKNLPSPFIKSYLNDFKIFSYNFAVKKTIENHYKYFCDSAPWTLLSINRIVKDFPETKIILCLRKLRGVIQSLERSYNSGHLWAGSTTLERLDLWKKFYCNVKDIPNKNLIVFNYSNFCIKPEQEIENLNLQLTKHNFDIKKFNMNIFTISHATKLKDYRPVSAIYDKSSGNIKLLPREDFKKDNISFEDELMFENDKDYKAIVEDIYNKLGISLF